MMTKMRMIAWDHQMQLYILLFTGFPGGSDVKVSAYIVGYLGSIPGSGRSPGEGNGNPSQLQYSCLKKSHGWRSLVGYSPWGHKDSDMTERLLFLSIIYIIIYYNYIYHYNYNMFYIIII